MAQLMEKNDPKRVTHMMRKDLRGGKVFIDWSQNDEHKTTAVAYSLRARRFTMSLKNSVSTETLAMENSKT